MKVDRREVLQRSKRKLFKSNGYIQYLNCVDGLWIHTYGKSCQIVHFKYVKFILCQLYLKVINQNRSLPLANRGRL